MNYMHLYTCNKCGAKHTVFTDDQEPHLPLEETRHFTMKGAETHFFCGTFLFTKTYTSSDVIPKHMDRPQGSYQP